MLTSAQIDQFDTDGFISLPSALEPEAIDEVRELLDPLFERFDSLPSSSIRYLGARTAPHERIVRTAEINRPTLLERRLSRARVYRSCHDLARQLGGRTVRYTFDHAIYKAPRNQLETPWHQDHAHCGHDWVLATFHFWIPLQEATVENGCMQFVPGSHHHGLREHFRHANGDVLETTVPSGWQTVACPIPLGGLTIHSPLILHYTGPNQSDQVRRAWILHFGRLGRMAKLHPAIVLERAATRARDRRAQRSR